MLKLIYRCFKSEETLEKQMKEFKLLDWYTAALVTVLLVSNIVSQKVIQIGRLS